jgi:SAM-dependent methyltransferase
MDIADEFPGAQVTGNDLSPIQPTWVPPNCKFYIEDVEADWQFAAHESFDFIHGRSMSGGIGDWPRLYEQIYRHLKPGGWVEIQEFACWMSSDDGTLEKATAIKEWLHKLNEASIKFGKRLNIAMEQKQNIINAGFVNVHEDVFKVRQFQQFPRLLFYFVFVIYFPGPFTFCNFSFSLSKSLATPALSVSLLTRDFCNRSQSAYGPKTQNSKKSAAS